MLLRQQFDCVLIFTILTTTLLIAATSGADPEYRLNADVLPTSYDIKITPYLLEEDGQRQFTFDGEVLITLNATLQNVKTITLHKDYITVKSVKLYEQESKNLLQTLKDEQLVYDSTTDKLSMNLDEALQLDLQYQLEIVYEGIIRDGMAGFYRASYSDENGEEKWMALTQAQRIDARTLFPCFDEPQFKAKFRLQISRPLKFSCYFNTKLVSTTQASDNRLLDTFEWTPVMSTYLVAFMIAEYQSRISDDVQIITRPEYLKLTDFSLEVAQRTVEAYNDYTQLPYKELGNSILQKASSPKFPHNGMENWGLVIYKDAVLVHQPYYNDGFSDKQYTIMILVHETAHMWFGNSVTFAWWSYFWLNEAFARYYQYFLAHELYPEYQLDQQFVVNQVHLIFGTDALNSSQPMTTAENLVQSPSQVASKFSAITYAKGAAIVRMIRNLMGKDNFDTAIRAYLKEYHLKNVVPENLFKHLKQQWPKGPEVNLDEFFFDWTEQVGYPVLFVNLAAEGTQVSISQTRFLLEPDDGSDRTLKYTVPITYATNLDRDFVNLEPVVYYNGSLGEFSWRLEKPIEWLIVNKQQSNYHRVFYDTLTLKRIRAALMEQNHGNIHVNNRAMLIDDLFNFARTGMIDYVAVFDFIGYLRTEVQYLPWYAAFSGLKRVAQRLDYLVQPLFGKFILDITEEVYDKLGLQDTNDTILDVYNRNYIVYWVCKYRHKDCNTEALELMTNQLTNISIDFRETLYCSANRYGLSKSYDQLVKLYQNETNRNEQELLLRAMGCTFYFFDTHYARALSLLTPVDQKATAIKPMCAENYENVTPVFSMFKRNVTQLATSLQSWSSAADIIADCANYFTTTDQLQMLEALIEDEGHLFGNSVSTLQRAVRTVNSNLDWAEKNLENLKIYLNQNYGKGGSGKQAISLGMVFILLLTVSITKAF